MNFDQARFNMVEQQIRPWEVLDSKVLSLLESIQREDFVPVRYRKLAFADFAIPLDCGQAMMRPKIEARMLQALDLKEDETVLEIGTGSGYLTACMAKLGDHVDTVDINEEMTAIAKKNLQSLAINNVNFSTGDASKTWHQKRNYDVIVISAAMKEIPASYKNLLKVGGRMFVVTGAAPAMTAHRVTRTEQDEWTVEDLFETSIEPMIETVKPIFEF